MTPGKKYRQYLLPLLIALGLIVIIAALSLPYGIVASDFNHPGFRPKYLYMLAGLVFPILVIAFTIKPVNKKFKDLKFEVASHRKQNRDVTPLSDFWLSLLSIPKEKYLSFLGRFIVLIWGLGWFLYYVAIWADFNHPHSISGILIYSAISALDLFFIDINSTILDNIQKIPYLVGPLVAAISFVAVLSSLSLFSLVIGMFLTRLLVYMKGREVVVTPYANNHIYIFFEKNEKVETLSKDILRADPKRGLVIFVEHEELSDDDKDGWSNLIKVFSSQRKLRYDSLNLSNQIHLKTHVSIGEAHSLWEKGIYPDLWDALGLPEIKDKLNSLARLNPQKENDKEDKYQSAVHLFFLSDNRDQNVLNSKLMADFLHHDNETLPLPKTIHCFSRRGAVTGIIEDSCSFPHQNLEVKIIDDACISVDSLKKDTDSLPVNFVEIDSSENFGSVKSPFTALIVGFGETGRDALRFIYEFGAFVSSEGDVAVRSPFKAYVVDEKMDKLKGIFRFNNPYINSDINVSHNRNDKLVEFLDYNDKSQEFYELLKEISPALNYVVVALGDDETNITVAVNILKMVRRYRPDLSRFRIFVRAYENSSFPHLANIAKRYNTTLKTESDGRPVIKVFGSASEIYTYEMIVDDDLLKEAKDYYSIYSEAYNKTSIGLFYPESGWDIRRKDALDTMVQGKIDDMRRKEFQDRQNALHKFTKYFILKTVIERNLPSFPSGDEAAGQSGQVNEISVPDKQRLNTAILDFINSCFLPDPSTGKYREENPCEVIYGNVSDSYEFASVLITNLAKTEHLRWNASHEMMGYSYSPGCGKSTVRMTHACLVPWDNLPQIFIATEGSPEENAKKSVLVRLFDYLVVETSFRHFKKDLEEKMSL